MANPCQFLQDPVDELEQEIQGLEELLRVTPPKDRAVINATIKDFRKQQSNLLKEVRACERDPTPFLLQMDGIEVTQSIQDMQHSVALIAGKRTVVRVYISYYASPDISVQGELLASADSGGLFIVSSSDHLLLSSANAGNLSAMRRDASLSLNFILPPEVTVVGGWTFSLKSLVNADGGGASLFVARAVSRKVEFVNAAPLRLRVLGVKYSMGSPATQFTPSDLDYNLLFSWLRRAYPVAQVIEIGSRMIIGAPNVAAPYKCDPTDPTPSPFCAVDVNKDIAKIRAKDVSGGVDHRTHYYGMVSDGGFFMRGLARHRQVEDPLGWRSRGSRISDPDDDASRPDLCRLSLSRRAHQLRGVAVFPL